MFGHHSVIDYTDCLYLLRNWDCTCDIIIVSTQWHNELNRIQTDKKKLTKTFTFGYDNYIIIIMGGR